MRVCIVGASGKLGQYMVQHALDRGYEVVGVCRQESVGKLDRFKGRVTVIPGATDDPEVIKRAVAGCDGVLVVMTPVGVNGYSTGTTQAVLDYAPPGARLVFSCGWHITRDVHPVLVELELVGTTSTGLRDPSRSTSTPVEACRRVFQRHPVEVVRGRDLAASKAGPARVERARRRSILASNLRVE